MNVLSFNGKPYKYESYWRNSRNVIIEDIEGNPLKWPKAINEEWPNKQEFIDQLNRLNTYIRRKNNFVKHSKITDCKLCDVKGISTGVFTLNKVRWDDSLIHYIEKHNTKPSEEFMDFVFRFHNKKVTIKRTTIMKGLQIKKFDKMYLKLDRNQILIMDALMKHGSQKQYVDKHNQDIFRYSEHAGLIDFNESGVEKIVVSGNTTRVDENDNEIYQPVNMMEAYDYEYIFHTHPATPKPGGRVNDGILYEFPSISDLFHFIEHYNMGSTQGSIIIAAEGMYIIRKHNVDNKIIEMNEDAFFMNTRRIINKCQEDAIEKYGTVFTSDEFYEKIASNKEYIQRINKIMNKYDLHIDYYPRIKDTKNRWIIDTIYLPVYVIENI